MSETNIPENLPPHHGRFTPPATPLPGESYILYAEDNLTDATFFIRALSRSSPATTCIHLENGSMAHRFLERGIELGHQLPQLIVLDIKMPGMSGLDLLEYIRSTPRLMRLPVVILSASAEPRDLNRAYDHDINAYLIKPNRYRDLNELVKMMVTFWIRHNQVPA